MRRLGEKLINSLNPLRANPTKWSNTLKQFVGKLPTNCLSVFDHFVKLTLEGLIVWEIWRQSLSFKGTSDLKGTLD